MAASHHYILHTFECVQFHVCEMWLLNHETHLKKSTLLMKLLQLHVIPFKVISTRNYLPLHTNLPGLEASLEVAL